MSLAPLEQTADALVTEITASDFAELESTPAFVARWDYNNVYDLQSHRPADPIDVFFMPNGETSELVNHSTLICDFKVDLAIRQKLATGSKSEISALRKFTDDLFYYWSPRETRRLTTIDRFWLTTEVQVAFVPEDLRRQLFFAVATLTFRGPR